MVDPAEVRQLLEGGARPFFENDFVVDPVTCDDLLERLPKTVTAARVSKWRKTGRWPPKRYRYLLELWEPDLTNGSLLLLSIDDSLPRSDRELEKRIEWAEHTHDDQAHSNLQNLELPP